MLEIGPILSALSRNRVAAVLVVLQIAITLAVVANAAFIIDQRLEKMERPTGIDSDNLFFVQSYGFARDYDLKAVTREDLEQIRALPGVVAASVLNSIPLSGGGSSSTYKAAPDANAPTVNGNYFETDESGLDALGVQLVAGRTFRADEVQTDLGLTSKFVPSVIVTRDFAREIFGEEDVVGRQVYDGLGQAATVIGVIENMQGSWVNASRLTSVVLHPRLPMPPVMRYVVRAEPGARDALIAEVERVLSRNRDRVITWVRPHDWFLERSYRPDLRMIVFLGVLIVWMLLLTGLGVVGLASFLVRIRTRQIGTRRAVGATRGDILRYFLVENWLLTTVGAALGVLLAFAFGQWLSQQYALPRLAPHYVLLGVLALWILGQVAVFVPARRAAAISPAIATRTV
jgi:putative ABC transport system permease protein